MDMLNSNPQVSQDIISKALSKINGISFNAGDASISTFKVDLYQHSRVDAKIYKRNGNYLVVLNIEGAHITVTGHAKKSTPWPLPDVDADFKVDASTMNIRIEIEASPEIIINPSGTTMKITNDPQFHVYLFNSGAGGLIEGAIESVIEGKKWDILNQLTGEASKMLGDPNFLKSQFPN
jgi:hypothetical protein